MKARLYYEAHITVKAEDDGFDLFAESTRYADWKASQFSEDEVDDMSGMWFASYRSTDMEVIRQRTATAIRALKKLGYEVMRWKIEDTLLDSKYGDTL